jgi:hypothetical protein
VALPRNGSLGFLKHSTPKMPGVRSHAVKSPGGSFAGIPRGAGSAFRRTSGGGGVGGFLHRVGYDLKNPQLTPRQYREQRRNMAKAARQHKLNPLKRYYHQ